MDGLTFTVMVGAVPLKAVLSERVPDIMPEPVTANDKLVELPLQIVVVPLRTAVGIALPSNSSAPISGAEPVPA